MNDIFDPVKCTEAGHPSLDRWNDLINEIAPQYNVPPNLVKAHMEYESSGDANVVSFDQGCGLMQITSGVTKVGELYLYGGENILDPRRNITVACRNFIAPAIKAFPGNLDAVIAAYNAGIGAVSHALAEGKDPSAVTYSVRYTFKVRDAYSWFNETAHAAMTGR